MQVGTRQIEDLELLHDRRVDEALDQQPCIAPSAQAEVPERGESFSSEDPIEIVELDVAVVAPRVAEPQHEPLERWPPHAQGGEVVAREPAGHELERAQRRQLDHAELERP